MEQLTEKDVQFYRENGYYLLKKPVLEDRLFQELERRFNEYYDAHPNMDYWDCPHWNDNWFLDLLCNKEILDKLVEPIIGPDISIFASSFLYKAPYSGKATPWHEDSSYYVDVLERFDNMVTIWLAIDPSNRANGCMKVVPGTHLNGFSEYEAVDMKENLFSKKVKQDIDEDQVVYFELNKNECSFHDSRIIHGGDKNTSATRRCGFQMRYFPSSVKFLPDGYKTSKSTAISNPSGWEGFKIYHARGKNLAGNTYANL